MLVRIVRAQWRPITAGVAAAVIWQVCVASVPIVLGATVERGIVDSNIPAVWIGGVLLIVIGVMTAATDALRHRWETLTESRVRVSLREHLAQVALDADPAGRERWPPGEVIARATGDVDDIAAALESIGYMVAYALIIPIVIAVLMFIDVPLAIVVVVTVVAACLVTWRSTVAWEHHTEVAQEALASSIAEAQSTLEGFKVIRGVGAEAGVIDAFERRSADVRDTAIRTARLWVVFGPVLDVFAGISVVAVLWIGGERAISGDIGLGDVVAATGLAMFLIEPLSSVGYGAVSLRRAAVSADRIARVSDAVPTRSTPIPDAGSSGDVTAVGDLVLQAAEVTFAYPGRFDQAAVSGVDLRLRAGSVGLIAGPVGAGKSTLLAVLGGDLCPTGGSVTWRGRDLRDVPNDDRRAAIVRLGPSPFLLAESLADNLRLGAPDATDDALHEALDLVHAGDIVSGLPDGLRTVLSDRGASLSGGQRQRLALARAVLARPDVLLLDSATSGLEPVRERALLERLIAASGDQIIVIGSSNPALRHLADVVVDLVPPDWHHARSTVGGAVDL